MLQAILNGQKALEREVSSRLDQLERKLDRLCQKLEEKMYIFEAHSIQKFDKIERQEQKATFAA